MELSPEVEDVIFGKTCRRETIKSSQGLDLRLLSTVRYGRMRNEDKDDQNPVIGKTLDVHRYFEQKIKGART